MKVDENGFKHIEGSDDFATAVHYMYDDVLYLYEEVKKIKEFIEKTKEE